MPIQFVIATWLESDWPITRRFAMECCINPDRAWEQAVAHPHVTVRQVLPGHEVRMPEGRYMALVRATGCRLVEPAHALFAGHAFGRTTRISTIPGDRCLLTAPLDVRFGEVQTVGIQSENPVSTRIHLGRFSSCSDLRLRISKQRKQGEHGTLSVPLHSLRLERGRSYYDLELEPGKYHVDASAWIDPYQALVAGIDIRIDAACECIEARLDHGIGARTLTIDRTPKQWAFRYRPPRPSIGDDHEHTVEAAWFRSNRDGPCTLTGVPANAECVLLIKADDAQGELRRVQIAPEDSHIAISS
ncbi:MAG: hypothetical protein KDC95_04850 [Planctomycetes bacterium]|nr:hypothetical protein [Planctomycetota bacterium]